MNKELLGIIVAMIVLAGMIFMVPSHEIEFNILDEPITNGHD
jgi:hypothetical protein